MENEKAKCQTCGEDAVGILIIRHNNETSTLKSCAKKLCFAECDKILSEATCYTGCEAKVMPIKSENMCMVKTSSKPCPRYIMCSDKCKNEFKEVYETWSKLSKQDLDMIRFMKGKPGVYINLSTDIVYSGLE